MRMVATTMLRRWPVWRFALMVALLLGLGDETGASSQRSIVVILAPPCGGASTQSPRITKALGIPHLDTGHILREAAAEGTPAGLEAKRVMDAGGLVPNDITNRVIAQRMAKPDCASGALLDGYPRNLNQFNFLDKLLVAQGESVSHVVLIDVPTKVLEERVGGRWESPSGTSYNVLVKGARRPQSLAVGAKPVCDPDDLAHCNMFDDDTGEPLSRRSDDNLKTLDTRIKEYHRLTEPVLAHYRDVLVEVDGNKSPDEVWAEIAQGLGIDSGMGLAADERADLKVVHHRPTELSTRLALVAVAALGALMTGLACLHPLRRSHDMKSEPLLKIT